MRQVDTAPKTPGQMVFPRRQKAGNNHNKFGGNFFFATGNVQTTPGPAGVSPAPGDQRHFTEPETLVMEVKVQCVCGTRFAFECRGR